MLPLLGLLLASSTASLAVGLYQTNEVNKENKKVSAENTKARILAARQQRVTALKERMAAQANLNVQTAATGTTGSSGEAGAMSSIQSQFGNAYAFSEATDLFGRKAEYHTGRANKAQYRAGVASTLFGVSNTLLSAGHSKGWFTPKPQVQTIVNTVPKITFTSMLPNK